MLRFYWVIFWNLIHIYMIPKMGYMAKHPERFSEEKRYRIARVAIRYMMRSGNIHAKFDGLENLPENGGYVMYPNHQGKYDALGIIYTHKKPCSIVMDKAKSNTILVKEFIDLIQGKRLDKKDVRQAITIINEMAEEVKQGRRFIIFPEGGYRFNNCNTVEDFKAGTFKSAIKSKAPIVPVALIDSYKAFNSFSFKKITTEVHYLEPLYYEEYKDMKSQEIAMIVKERILSVLNQYDV